MSVAHARDDLLDLLTTKGWGRVGVGSDGSLWRSSDERSTVAIPEGLTTDSYEWPGILERVAYGLGESVPAVRDMVLMRFTDVTELHAETGDAHGSVPLATGVVLVEAAQVLVRSSATASRIERLSIDGHYSSKGDELAAQARMAHTRDGSYVLPILMPLPRPEPSGDENPLDLPRDLHESDERRTMRTLAQAVVAIHGQIVQPSQAPTPEALGNLLLAGATREAVVAVERLLTAESVDGVAAHFAWAAGLRGPTYLPSSVTIPAQAAPLLHESAALMRSAPKPSTERFTGPIVELRDPHDGWGVAAVQTVRRGRPCEIHVAVSPDLLGTVHDWFRANESVVVAGKVVSGRGKPLRIPEPHTFMRVADTQLF